MGYVETVQSKLPIGFAYLNELFGATIINYGTETGDGTYYPDAIRGQPSPIESDASSYSVRDRCGTLPISAPVNAFSFGGWGFWADTIDGLQNLGAQAIVCRNGQVGVTTSNMLVIDGSGQLGVRLCPNTNPGDILDLAYILPVPNQFYRCMVVRNGTHVELRVNAEIVAQTDSFIAGPMTRAEWINGDATGTWRLGVTGPTGNIAQGYRTLGIEIYDYPLSLADDLEIYEAAFNAIFLNGVSNVLSTAILLSGFDPDPISFPAMRHNWTEPLIERVSFRSDISRSITGVEEGNGLRIAPRRELEFTQLIRNNTERRQLRAQLWANQHAKWFIPVRQYAERLVEPLSSGATSTPITPTYKDYEVGLWIGFRQYDSGGNVEHSEERLITALNLNSIEHEALANDYVAHRSIVYPVRRALLQSSLTVKGHTDSVEEVVFTARLLPEDERVAPNRIATFAPTIKYRDVEVFDGQLWQSHDWSEQREYEIQRAGELIDFDTGLIGFESDTAGATETFTYQMKLSGLENIAQFLGWYYEHVGALRPLWVSSMQEDFDIQFVNLSEDQIEVSGNNYSNNYALAESRRDIAFVYWDGSVRLRRVIAFEIFGSNEKLTLDADVPTLTNLRFVSLLKYCRLDADQLELAWHTDQAVVVQWRFRELLHTPEGVGLSSLSPSSSQSVSLSPSHSPSPSASVSLSPSPSASASPSASQSPSGSVSPSASGSPSSSVSPSPSLSLSPSASASPSASSSPTPSSSASGSPSPSSSVSPSA